MRGKGRESGVGSSEFRVRSSTFVICSYILISLIFLIINPSAVLADDNDVRLKGYVKSLATLTDFTGLDLELTGSKKDEVPKLEGASVNTVRLNMFFQSSTSLTAELAYELVPRVQDPEGSES